MGTQERKERERGERRNAILSSARAAFIKHGLTTTSMERIAKEAELAKGTLYLYFHSKDELLMGLISNDLEVLIQRLSVEARMPISADEKLFHAFAEFHAFSRENQFFFQVMTQLNVAQMVGGDHSQETLANFSRVNQRVVGIIQSIVNEGVEAGVFVLHAPLEDVVVQLIIAIKGSIVILKNNMVPPYWVRQDEQTLLKQIVQTLLRGISSPGVVNNTHSGVLS